jgi:hypothetical protein
MALSLDAEWRKQEADPKTYRFGKHVYPPKVLSKHIHALVDERNDLLARLEQTERELAQCQQAFSDLTTTLASSEDRGGDGL